MIDYHAIQLTGSACQGKNCACASCAMAIYFGSGGKVRLTADQVRTQSGISCIPNVRTPSGGLYIGDVIRVAARNGVVIDYGRDPVTYYERWPLSEAKTRLSGPWGGIFLGDYDGLKVIYRAPGSTFLGDHSSFGHDYRTDLPAFGSSVIQPTICWHDPLRKAPIRLPLTALAGYWQKVGSPVRGYAGFVRIPAPVVTATSTLHVAPGAVIRRYTLTGGCISGWDKPDLVWTGNASSAPCSATVRRKVCGSTSTVTTAFVTGGAFKGRYVRVGSAYGVTVS